jgi:hypothetical protein
MSMRDHYRTRAAEFHARARMESDEWNRRQFESLANLRLAEQADRDTADWIYEPPPRKTRRE